MTRLEQLRVDAGLTREQLGERVGVHYGTIRRIEDGHRAFPATLKAIGDYFGVPASSLQREAMPASESA